MIINDKYQYIDSFGKKWYTYKFYTDISPNSDYVALNTNLINTIFQKRGNWIESRQHDKATLMFIDLYSYEEQKKTYSYKSDITNIIKVNPKKNLNKSNLYNLLWSYDADIALKFMMKQYDINLSNYKLIDKNIFLKPQILKPVHSWGGAGIVIFKNYTEYITYLGNYSKQKSRNLKPSKMEWVLAEYIDEPMLLKNRKFHLRIPFLYYKNKGYIAKEYRIITAASEYKKSDYSNKEIHDTHLTGSLQNYFFPTDFPHNQLNSSIINIIQNHIDELFSHITKIMNKNNFTYDCYDGTNYCFTIYGADVMITSDYQIKLLEFNSRAGFTYNGTYVENMINDVALIILDELYPPENKIFEEKKFFKDITLSCVSKDTHSECLRDSKSSMAVSPEEGYSGSPDSEIIDVIIKQSLASTGKTSLENEYYQKYIKYKKKYLNLKKI